MVDLLDLFLDDADVAVTAKSSEKPKSPADIDEDALDLLMEEFRSASDSKEQKDALLAMLKLTGRSR